MTPMNHLGFTRSVSRREYLLHTPDAFVRTPLPGLSGGSAIVHVAPKMGADFAMSTVELEAGGSLEPGPAQRFAYVLDGTVQLLTGEDVTPRQLGVGSFSLLTEGDASRLIAPQKSRIVMFEKRYIPVARQPAPTTLHGQEAEVIATPLNGDERTQVRCLLPDAPSFDFAVNTMTYAPGASLPQVEVHSMEHGLLMLEGSGVYRLGDDWHPVTAGDVIWMAPFCPQWFTAVGDVPARYLIYKDLNRHVLA